MHRPFISIAALTILIVSPCVQAQWVKTSSAEDTTSYLSTKPIIYQGLVARIQMLTDLKEPETL